MSHRVSDHSTSPATPTTPSSSSTSGPHRRPDDRDLKPPRKPLGRTAGTYAGALVTVPLVIMVLLFQRRIISGLTAGGLKS